MVAPPRHLSHVHVRERVDVSVVVSLAVLVHVVPVGPVPVHVLVHVCIFDALNVSDNRVYNKYTTYFIQHINLTVEEKLES